MSTKYNDILPTAADLMRFRIFTWNNEEVMGQNAELPLCNAVFFGVSAILEGGENSLPKVSGSNTIAPGAKLNQLAVNEWARVWFSMSGTTGIYRVVRVK